jgi:NADH-quinone oxidoreductase subunit L
VYLAYLYYLKNPELRRDLYESDLFRGAHRLWFTGWGFDRLYGAVFVRAVCLPVHREQKRRD